MKRFLNLIVYILTIHVSALLIAGLFRLVLFISSYHQLTSEALSDKTLPMLAFVHGVWFDNVIGCYILLLPLVVAVVFATIMGKRCSVSLRSFSVSFMDWFI